jgi:hypothetical protein
MDHAAEVQALYDIADLIAIANQINSSRGNKDAKNGACRGQKGE